MAQHDAVAKAFVEHYYNTFDTNRAGLPALYQETSMMTFEGREFGGQAAIAQKFSEITWQSKHYVNACHAQPTPCSGVLVMVSGNIVLEGEEHPLKFSQSFHLMPLAGGAQWFVANDIFQLNYG
mmetsp:Transcript_14939/g.48972  ORF Transcript_14939/g.48972 Transcript_14939/m.48972 type:complete len:124 (-) Transcript_14939:73-444(-)